MNWSRSRRRRSGCASGTSPKSTASAHHGKRRKPPNETAPSRVPFFCRKVPVDTPLDAGASVAAPDTGQTVSRSIHRNGVAAITTGQRQILRLDVRTAATPLHRIAAAVGLEQKVVARDRPVGAATECHDHAAVLHL